MLVRAHFRVDENYYYVDSILKNPPHFQGRQGNLLGCLNVTKNVQHGCTDLILPQSETLYAVMIRTILFRSDTVNLFLVTDMKKVKDLFTESLNEFIFYKDCKQCQTPNYEELWTTFHSQGTMEIGCHDDAQLHILFNDIMEVE